jgi:hypothetical protein
MIAPHQLASLHPHAYCKALKLTCHPSRLAGRRQSVPSRRYGALPVHVGQIAREGVRATPIPQSA